MNNFPLGNVNKGTWVILHENLNQSQNNKEHKRERERDRERERESWEGNICSLLHETAPNQIWNDSNHY